MLSWTKQIFFFIDIALRIYSITDSFIGKRKLGAFWN